MTLSQIDLGDSRFFDVLWKCDQDLARQAKADAGGVCAECGGALHQGNFPRKPRGGRGLIGPEYKLRLGFCCSTDGCRSRLTPPSVRFLGRRFYLGSVIVLVSALRDGLTERRAAELRELIGVSTRTLRRWRGWWQEIFAASPFWKSVRDRFLPPIDAKLLPSALLDRFSRGRDDLLRLLRFLSPITTRAGLAMAG